MRSRRALLLVATVLLVGLALWWSQRERPSNAFEIAWTKVNETYFDTTFGGVDWKEAHDRYAPRIAAAGSEEERYGLVNRMLWELRVSHANLVPPGRLSRYEPLACAEGSPGMDLRLLDGVAVATFVAPGSPADDAGLRPGHVIQAVDGVAVEQILREAEAVARPPDNGPGRIARATKAVLGRVYGAAGTEVSVAYTDERGISRERRLARKRRSGRAIGPGGILYLAVELDARRLDGKIGYVRLNVLQPPLARRVADAIKSLGNLRGLVFDLRGNSGGEAEGMPDLFLKERTLLYLERSRAGESRVYADPAEDAFDGPLVLLIDQLTGSAGELLAGCLQAIGRATIVGERSPGAVTESDMTVLGNGAILMYPVAQLVTPDGTVLEGRGVIPDIEIGLDRQMVLKGVDSQLAAAVRHLETRALR